MIRTTALMIFAFGWCVPTIVAAQETGTRIERNRGAVNSVSDLTTRSAIAVANVFAQCIAQRKPQRVRLALDLALRSSEQAAALQQAQEVSYDACLGSSTDFDQLASTRLLLAGGAAEFFVRAVLAKVDLMPLRGMSDAVLEATTYRPRNALEDFGLCLVRRDPERARALVMTKPTFPDETRAFMNVIPDVGPCIVQGEKIEINKPNLRSVVAYALYRASSKLAGAR